MKAAIAEAVPGDDGGVGGGGVGRGVDGETFEASGVGGANPGGVYAPFEFAVKSRRLRLFGVGERVFGAGPVRWAGRRVGRPTQQTLGTGDGRQGGLDVVEISTQRRDVATRTLRGRSCSEGR